MPGASFRREAEEGAKKVADLEGPYKTLLTQLKQAALEPLPTQISEKG